MAEIETELSRGQLWARLFSSHISLKEFRDETTGDIKFKALAAEIINIDSSHAEKVSQTNSPFTGKEEKIAKGLRSFFSGESETIGSWEGAERNDVSATVTSIFEKHLGRLTGMDVKICLSMARDMGPQKNGIYIANTKAERKRYADALRYVMWERDLTAKMAPEMLGSTRPALPTLLERRDPEDYSMDRMAVLIFSSEGYGYPNSAAFFADAKRIEESLLKALDVKKVPKDFFFSPALADAFRAHVSFQQWSNRHLSLKLRISEEEVANLLKAPSSEQVPLLLKASDSKTIYILLRKGREAATAFAQQNITLPKAHKRALHLVMQAAGETPDVLGAAIKVQGSKIENFTTTKASLKKPEFEAILVHYGLQDADALLEKGRELENEGRAYRRATQAVAYEMFEEDKPEISPETGLTRALIDEYIKGKEDIAPPKQKLLPAVFGFESPKSFFDAGERAIGRLRPIVEIEDGHIRSNIQQQINLKFIILGKKLTNDQYESAAARAGVTTNKTNFTFKKTPSIPNSLKWVEGFGFETVSDFLSGDESKSVWKRIKPYEAKKALESFLEKSDTSIETFAKTCGIDRLKEQLGAVISESRGACFSIRPLMFAMRQAKSESLDAFVAEHLERHLKDVFQSRRTSQEIER